MKLSKHYIKKVKVEPSTTSEELQELTDEFLANGGEVDKVGYKMSNDSKMLKKQFNNKGPL